MGEIRGLEKQVQRWDLGESGESRRAAVGSALAGAGRGFLARRGVKEVLSERGDQRVPRLGDALASAAESRENGGSALGSGKSRGLALRAGNTEVRRWEREKAESGCGGWVAFWLERGKAEV